MSETQWFYSDNCKTQPLTAMRTDIPFVLRVNSTDKNGKNLYPGLEPGPAVNPVYSCVMINVIYQRAGHITKRATFPHFPTL